MKTSVGIIHAGFARHVLGNQQSGNPAMDVAHALQMNHKLLGKASSCRLNKWAIFRESGSTIATPIEAYRSGDERTVTEAFSDELLDLREPVVLAIFSKALLNLSDVRATYDRRHVCICAPDTTTSLNADDPLCDHWLARALRKKEQADAA